MTFSSEAFFPYLYLTVKQTCISNFFILTHSPDVAFIWYPVPGSLKLFFTVHYILYVLHWQFCWWWSQVFPGVLTLIGHFKLTQASLSELFFRAILLWATEESTPGFSPELAILPNQCQLTCNFLNSSWPVVETGGAWWDRKESTMHSSFLSHHHRTPSCPSAV